MTIVLFVMAWNLVGDALRDILDPRLTGSRAWDQQVLCQ